MPLGNHLCAHQYVNFPRMNASQLGCKRAFESGGVGINAGNTGLASIGPFDVNQQFGQMLFEPLGAAAYRCDVDIPAVRAGAGYPFSKSAMVAAQDAVDLVKNAVGAAMRAFAFPAAIVAGQHRRIATPVQENQRLLAPRNTFCNGVDERRRNHAVFRLVVHVHASNDRQAAGGRQRRTRLYTSLQVGAAGLALPDRRRSGPLGGQRTT